MEIVKRNVKKIVAGILAVLTLLVALFVGVPVLFPPTGTTAGISTFGKTNIGASTVSMSTTGIYVCRFQLLEAGDIFKISCYLYSEPQGYVKALIYADNAGAPGAKLAVSNVITCPASYNWIDFTISYSGSNGTYYWLSVHSQNNIYVKYDAGVTNQMQARENAGYPTDPDPFGTPDYIWAREMSIYATYSGSSASTSKLFKTTTSDGYMRAGETVYAEAFDAYGNSSDTATYNTTTTIQVGQLLSGPYYICRAFLFFDTSSLPDNVTILEEKLMLNISTDSSTTDFNITVWVPEFHEDRPTTNLIRGNYQDYWHYFYEHSTGELGRLSTTGGLTLKQYYNITLSKRQTVNTLGITKFILRSDRELAKIPPPNDERVIFYSNETAPGVPMLNITYMDAVQPLNMAHSVNWKAAGGDGYYNAMIRGLATPYDMLQYISNISETNSVNNWQQVLYWTVRCRKYGTACENQTKIQWALNNATMLSDYLSIPNSTKLFAGDSYFNSYDGELLFGYNYSLKYNYATVKWNITRAFEQFEVLFNNSALSNRRNGWLLMYSNSSYYLGTGGQGRFYDENAETMRIFLIFNEIGNTTEMRSKALADAKCVWGYLNDCHWMPDAPQHFNYGNSTFPSSSAWECEAGGFLQIAAWLRWVDPATPNMIRLVTDATNRYVDDRWDSEQWCKGTLGGAPCTYRWFACIHEHFGNNESRLAGTVMSWAACMGIFDLFSDAQRQNITDMLSGYTAGNNTFDPAWKMMRHYNCSLYNATSAMWRATSSSSTYTAIDTALAAGLQFMLSIVPVNCTLAVPIEELHYEYVYNMLDYELFNVTLDTNTVVISVYQPGYVKFIFNQTVYRQFTEANGTYRIVFSSDWNGIVSSTWLGYLPQNRRFLNLITQTTLDVGWNNVTATVDDVGKTLSQVNASLCYDGINYTELVLEYTNGSQYEVVFGWGGDLSVLIMSTDDRLYINCLAAGVWNHSYG